MVMGIAMYLVGHLVGHLVEIGGGRSPWDCLGF